MREENLPLPCLLKFKQCMIVIIIDSPLLFIMVLLYFVALSDKNKREIYDLYGVEGLRALTQVSTSHSSLREEVERIKRERQEERQRQRTNAKVIAL
jgi:hypothetical protein